MVAPNYEVWRLEAAAGTRGRYWQCLVPPVRSRGQQRDYDKGRSFYYGPHDKKKKLSKALVGDGDYMVVDLAAPSPQGIAHHVPKKLLGGGDLYLCTADNPTTVWQKLDVAGLGQGSATAAPATGGGGTGGGTGKGKGKGKGKSGTAAPKLPAYLDRIEAKTGTLVALRPVFDRQGLKAAKSDDIDLGDYLGSYAYTIIRGTEVGELEFLSHSWTLVQAFDKKSLGKDIVQEIDPKSFAQLIEDQRLDLLSNLPPEIDVDALADKIHELIEAVQHVVIRDALMESDSQVGKLARDVLLEAVPSATPGSTAILGALNSAFGELQRQGTVTADAFDGVASGIAQAGFEDAGTIIAIAYDIIQIVELHTSDRKPTTGTLKAKYTDLLDHAAKLTTGTTKIAELIAASVHGAESSLATGLGAWGGVGSAAIGYFTASRSTLKGIRTARRRARIMEIHRKVHRACINKQPKPEIWELVTYIAAKLHRRGAKQWSTVVAGSVGATSGVLFALVVFGVLNAWNPAGWILLGIAGGVGLGVVMYSSIRHFTKSHRREHRKKRGRPGTVDQFTDRLIKLMLDETADGEDRGDAFMILRALVWKQLRPEAARKKMLDVVREKQRGRRKWAYQFLRKSDNQYEGLYVEDNQGNWIAGDISAQTLDYVRTLVKRHVKK